MKRGTSRKRRQIRLDWSAARSRDMTYLETDRLILLPCVLEPFESRIPKA